jgi:membrane protease subunit HflK
MMPEERPQAAEPTWKDILLSGLKAVPYRDGRVIWGGILVAVAVYFLSGIYAVQPEEMGVVVRFGKVVEDAVTPGIHYHLPYPFERVYRPKVAEVKSVLVGATNRTRDVGLEMLTGDTNVIMVQVIIQYAISDPVKYLFATEDAKMVVAAVVEEALSRIVGSMGVDDVLTTEKLLAQNMVKQRVEEVLDSYNAGVKVMGAYFQEIGPPVEVAYAFRDVASAREDRNRLINEAEGYSNTIIPSTRGRAEGAVRDAEAYSKERVEMASGEAERFLSLLTEYRKSPELTASRIYTERMEKILDSLTVYVLDKEDGKGISNLRFFLPQTTPTTP